MRLKTGNARSRVAKRGSVSAGVPGLQLEVWIVVLDIHNIQELNVAALDQVRQALELPAFSVRYMLIHVDDIGRH